MGRQARKAGLGKNSWVSVSVLFFCDCGRMPQALSILLHRQGRSLTAALAEGELAAGAVRYQSMDSRMLRDSCILKPEQKNRTDTLTQRPSPRSIQINFYIDL